GLEMLNLFLGTGLDAGERVPGISVGPDQLVELEMKCLRVPVLRGLNEEDHQERHHGRPGVDDELPGITEAKEGTGVRTNEDKTQGEGKSDRTAEKNGATTRESPERITHLGKVSSPTE